MALPPSHDVEFVTTVPKDPELYPARSGMSTHDQLSALDENRPTQPHPMQWAVLTRR